MFEFDIRRGKKRFVKNIQSENDSAILILDKSMYFLFKDKDRGSSVTLKNASFANHAAIQSAFACFENSQPQ